MIIDRIENFHLYKRISNKLEKGLQFIIENDLGVLEAGKYEIDGKGIYGILQEYDTKAHEDGRWEAHQQYIDIQYIVDGAEMIGYANTKELKIIESYNQEKDVMFLEGKGELIAVRKGYFMILFPQDAHMPCLRYEENNHVKKLVIKIALDGYLSNEYMGSKK